MLTKSQLKDLLQKPDLTQKDKVLLCLAVDSDRAKTATEAKSIALECGLREARKWNISTILGRAKRYAIRTREGWELTTFGKERVQQLAGEELTTPITKAGASLRSHLSAISDPQIVAFLEEAIKCCEARLYRAAVVLSWVGAISVLYDYVVKNELAAFNTEALRRDAKWKQAKTSDDLARMKESVFLEILETLSLIGKNVKNQLKGCLDLRNSCGHPNSYTVGENNVASHIETLTLNVFSKF